MDAIEQLTSAALRKAPTEQKYEFACGYLEALLYQTITRLEQVDPEFVARFVAEHTGERK